MELKENLFKAAEARNIFAVWLVEMHSFARGNGEHGIGGQISDYYYISAQVEY